MNKNAHFTMDPGEIVVEYRRAANRNNQIKILAELNACQQRDIAEFLASRGESLPKNWVEAIKRPRVPGRAKRMPKTGEGAGMDPAPPLPQSICMEEATEPQEQTEPLYGGDLADDRDLFKALASSLPATVMHEPGIPLSAIRATAFELISREAPAELERFRGFVQGIAKLIETLGEVSQ